MSSKSQCLIYTGSDLSGGDVTTKRVKDKINGKVGREKDQTKVQLLKSSQDHEPVSTTPETDKGTNSGQRPNSVRQPNMLYHFIVSKISF